MDTKKEMEDLCNIRNCSARAKEFNDRARVLMPEILLGFKNLESENKRLIKMFVEDCFIESATLEPNCYDLRVKGKGAMLVAGSLIRMFRESGGKNFVVGEMSMEFDDPKFGELYEFTIQKLNGEDSPVQKVQRLEKECERLRSDIVTQKMTYEKYIGGPEDDVEKLKGEIARWQNLAQEYLAMVDWISTGVSGKYSDIHKTNWNGIKNSEGQRFKDIYSEFMGQAAQELGIAISDHIADPNKLMLTAEQRAALGFTLGYMGDDPNDSQDFDLINSIKVIRSMFTRFVPVWEITEKRRAVIKSIVRQYDPKADLIEYQIISDEIDVLKTMMEEAGVSR